MALVVLVSLLWIVPSPASAVSNSNLSTAVNLAPPYHHTIPELSGWIFHSYCNSSAAFIKYPQASPRTGVGQLEESAHSFACANQYSQASIVGSVGFGGMNFTATSNTTMNVTFVWNVTWTATLSATVPSGSSVYNSYANGQLYQEDMIFDTADGSPVGYAFAMLWENFTTNGSAHFGSTNLSSASALLPVIAGHTYELQPSVFAFASTYANPGSTARMLVNVGTAGCSAKLVLISIA